MVERKSVVVYYTNEDFVRSLTSKDINVHYISRNNKCAILYFDSVKEKEVMQYLTDSNHITEIDISNVPYEKYSF